MGYWSLLARRSCRDGRDELRSWIDRSLLVRRAGFLHARFRPVVTGVNLFVPAALGILILNQGILALHLMRGRGSFGGNLGFPPRCMGLRKYVVNLVGPAAVMLDNPVDHLRTA